MTNEYEYTRNLDLLGDWLDAKGYGEEAGLITRSMDYMHKQAARIAELEAALKQSARVEASLASRIANLMDALEPFADRSIYCDKYCPDREQMPVGLDELRAARAAYLGEKE